ncbi:ParA family protein [Pontibacter sp. G13]|uniref:ParA family protein n=1 Tax=Pontibacter sp. G13 TaxID=3074898 RepID=UPI00288A711F|nr:ParA family protein [Pontibacter sp. G13]WNJ21576.1 ParA family protein [Pontibacter sp. G13]
MARVIVIANSKGGTGKSTITLNLYQYFIANGASCGILDTDLQQSITLLDTNYEKNIALVDPHTSPEALKDIDYEIVLVDTPPYRTGAGGFMSVADFVLIPVNPSPMDAMAIHSILADVQEAGVKHAVVLNRVAPKTSLTDEIRKTIEAFGCKVLQTQINNRVAYSRSLIYDDLDSEANAKASVELSSLANEVLRLML